jgi:hypothetical protein
MGSSPITWKTNFPKLEDNLKTNFHEKLCIGSCSKGVEQTGETAGSPVNQRSKFWC